MEFTTNTVIAMLVVLVLAGVLTWAWLPRNSEKPAATATPKPL